MYCFDSQSTTTRIVVYLKELGSCSMKSIEMEFHGFSRIGSCLSKPKGLCLGTFAHAQVVQEETFFDECPNFWPSVFVADEF